MQIRTQLMIVGFLALASIPSSYAMGRKTPEFKDCYDYEASLILNATEDAIGSAEEIAAQIQADLNENGSNYDWMTRSKLQNAISTLNCAKSQLIAPSFRCGPRSSSIAGRTAPFPGAEISLFGVQEQGGSIIGNILHEATHHCGTNDAAYFVRQGVAPHDVAIFGWDSIASTYNYWVTYGYCVPGVSC